MNLTRQCSGFFFGLARTSATPFFHAISGAFKQNVYGAAARTRKFKGEREREGEDRRDSTPKNMGSLMPAAKSRC